MKILKVDKVQIRIEKQPNSSKCKWCLHCQVEKKNMSKLLFMVMTDTPPYLLFQENKINLIENSKKIKYEILKHSEA
jgi:hypothetical protein